jgi:protein O-GlcNAc transferase
VDSFTDPENSKQKHVEKLIRMKHFLCYTPSSIEKADVSPPPVLKTNVITFGTFNNMAKITQRVCTIWAKILKQVPNSVCLLISLI